MKRLKKFEIAVIAVTLAVTCYTVGYFTKVKVAPNVPAITQSTPYTFEPSTDPSALESPSLETPALESPAAITIGKININTAGIDELTDLPGIGSELARRIVEYRTENGEFETIDELLNVSGIGEKKLAAMSDQITIEQQ